MAKKHLGQNFLKSYSVLQKIIAAADLNKDDHVIEIGPGQGFLTEALLEKAGKVTAIEKDHDLIEPLQEKFPDLDLIEGDALKFSPPETPYKVVANIPYYITSPLINHFLKDTPHHPEFLVLMTQKEVANKAAAKPGKLNVLALNIQTFGNIKKICKVPASAFSPQPKVESAVIKITPHKEPLVPEKILPTYFKLISNAFSQKRKMLGNTLGKETCEKAGIDPMKRPQHLTIQEWAQLANALQPA